MVPLPDMFDMFNTLLFGIAGAHPYVHAALIMLAALLAALVVLPVVAGVVKYLTRKTPTDIDDRIIAALIAPITYAALLVGALFALPFLGLYELAERIAVSLVHTLFVLVAMQVVLRVVRIMLEGAVRVRSLRAVNEQTLPLFRNVALIIIGAAGVYALFLVWGIDVTAWLASAGIIGIAVGFAAKDTLSNIISGIFILADKPYAVGDLVVLGSGTTGFVRSVGLRSTRIETFDDEEVTIPNATIANEAITNKSTGPDTGKVAVTVGVAYGTNTAQVEELLLDIASAHELVLKDPAPFVRFTNFGDSSLDFLLVCRVKDPLDVYKTTSDVRLRINDRFAEANIEIPFPQRDVHVKNDTQAQ